MLDCKNFVKNGALAQLYIFYFIEGNLQKKFSIQAG